MPQRVQKNRRESIYEFDPAREMSPPRAGAKPTLLPPDQLARYSLPTLPTGEYLWQMTRRVQHEAHLEFLSGRVYDRYVYFVRNGKQFVKAYSPPRDPRTERQLDQRQRFVKARAVWRQITQAQRDAWTDFALRHEPWPERQLQKHLLGISVWTSCQMQRMTWDDAPRAEAPTRPRPLPPGGIEEVPAPAGQFAFRVTHRTRDLAGCRLLLEMTPATQSLAHKVLERRFTRAGSTDAGSFFPLAKSGETYILESPRHQVKPGERYGVRVSVLTEDGLKSESLTIETLRLEPTPAPTETPVLQQREIAFRPVDEQGARGGESGKTSQAEGTSISTQSGPNLKVKKLGHERTVSVRAPVGRSEAEPRAPRRPDT